MTRVPDPVERLWRSITPPDSDALAELAREAATEPQRAASQPNGRRRIRARWVVAVGVVALLVGSGLGFGLGSSVTPSGGAGRNVVGFGFLPDRGWNVVQRAGPGPGTTTAVASNDGIVLSVTSTPRGDPAEDVAYALHELPLRVADAHRSTTDPSRLELRAGVGGYNIDARISFATSQPTPAMLAAVQRQLNRLVIAADRVTIAVRPAIGSAGSTVTVFGTVDSGRVGESVTVQAKDCGTSFFRVFAGANTEAGGSWSTFIFPRISTRLRAVWSGETSTEIVYRHRVFMTLRQLARTQFRVFLGASTWFTGKRVNIQRFDARLARWNTVKQVPAAEEYSGTRFTLRVPKGTRIRAVFPNSQAKPCYLGGTSPVIRT